MPVLPIMSATSWNAARWLAIQARRRIAWVAEIYDDNSALFVAPNSARRCTSYSIAAHSLYEESHPQLQFYPENVLAMKDDVLRSRCTYGRHPR